MAFSAAHQLVGSIELAQGDLDEADWPWSDSSVFPVSKTLSDTETAHSKSCLQVVEFDKAQREDFAVQAKPYP